MTDVNNVVLVGNVVRDCGADERSFAILPSGKARANITIAVNRGHKEASGEWVEEANYFDVTIWGSQASSLKQYLVKGQKIAVQGYLKQDRWEKDGQKQSRISITAEMVQLIGNRNSAGTSEKSDKPYNKAETNKVGDFVQNNSNGFDSDIPF